MYYTIQKTGSATKFRRTWLYTAAEKERLIVTSYAIEININHITYVQYVYYVILQIIDWMSPLQLQFEHHQIISVIK